ncbi:hypothetical protein GGR88_001615 [Sphingomonas jejuensis]|uniref:Uncharacterized protein n=1 Tax=Sphingomonas jejuensis TaxID=904715 RepID=A0ABX0XN27_9SPHN|nr:DUF6445 family protein [Sphingomonas jejuensis]NJC34141.1 hypothetical protein [Sphingomonas jejuensis]
MSNAEDDQGLTTIAPLAPVSTRLGREGEQLLKIERLLSDPSPLIRAAAVARYTPAYGPAGGYPGIRAPAPPAYVRAVALALFPLIRDVFALGDVRLGRAEATLSLVTLPPDTLVPAQRVPHVDTHHPLQFAILHYLCGEEFGGTAFFRHRATGFETLAPDRQDLFDTAQADEQRGHPPEGYRVGSDRWFEEIGRVDAAFNRVAVYRSRLLHSGVIASPERLSADPARGRLTANIFLTLRQNATAGGTS